MFNNFVENPNRSIENYGEICEKTGLYNNNQYVVSKDRDGKFVGVTNAQSMAEKNNPYNLGWKLHVSINPKEIENFKKGWSIFASLVLKYNLNFSKVAVIASSASIYAPGKEITVYLEREKEKDNLHCFLAELEYNLTNAGIKPNPAESPDCREISKFISFRHDRCIESDWPKIGIGEQRVPYVEDAAGYIRDYTAYLVAKILEILQGNSGRTDSDLRRALLLAIQKTQQDPNVSEHLKNNTKMAHLNLTLSAQIFYIVKKNLDKPFDISNPFDAPDKFELKSLDLKKKHTELLGGSSSSHQSFSNINNSNQ